MMRILSPQISIAPGSNLGGAVFDRELLKELAALGALVDIPLPSGEPYEEMPGRQIVPTPRHRLYTYEYNLLFLPAVNRLWRAHPYDLYRVHSPSLAPLGLWMQRRTGRPLTAHHHHIEESQATQNRITAFALPRYDLVTVDSRFVLEQLTATFDFDPTRAVVTSPGVAPTYAPGPADPALRAELGAWERCLILTMSVLTPRKNLRLLIEAFARLPNVANRFVLVVAGDGPQRAELQALVAELDLEQAVRFAGYVDEAKKLALLRSADLFAFPSRLEGFGMAVAEAMACGLPVLSSSAASLPEVTGDAALLVSPDDLDGWTAALARLCTETDLRRRLAEAGRSRVTSLFSWRRTAEITLDAYTRLLHTRAKS